MEGLPMHPTDAHTEPASTRLVTVHTSTFDRRESFAAALATDHFEHDHARTASFDADGYCEACTHDAVLRYPEIIDDDPEVNLSEEMRIALLAVPRIDGVQESRHAT